MLCMFVYRKWVVYELSRLSEIECKEIVNKELSLYDDGSWHVSRYIRGINLLLNADTETNRDSTDKQTRIKKAHE